MKPIKWNDVKKRAVLHSRLMRADGLPPTKLCLYAIMSGRASGNDWRKNAAEMQKACHDIIMRWDIRNVRKLHELIPECLPKDCQYNIGQTENGQWVIMS